MDKKKKLPNAKDKNLNSGIFSAIAEKPSGTEENLKRMMKHIPGGIIMYRWDGEKLNVRYISEYYAKHYGTSMSDKGANLGQPDFHRIHPDDVDALQAAIKHALATTHKLTYVYRAWDDKADRYLWKKLNGVAEDIEEDGSCNVYAIYTDITEEIDAKLEAEKNHEILKASIAASGQFCFELDPTTDIMICPPEQAKIFDLPADYIDFPESLFQVGGILEEARPIADELMEKLHNGVEEAECELRMYTKGDYLWYRFCFHAWDDPNKGYPIYLCSFTNINDQKVAEEKYISSLETISHSNGDAIAFFRVNLTKNTCDDGNSDFSHILELQKEGKGKLDECFAQAEDLLVEDSEKQQYHAIFGIENMKKNFKEGKTHIEFQHRFPLENGRIEWIETSVDLVQNPKSNDIEGYISVRNINAKKLDELILKIVIRRDYHALIYFDPYEDEYMMLDNISNQYFVKKEGVYKEGVELGLRLAAEEEKPRLRKLLTKEIIINKLSESNEYSIFYEGTDHHKRYQLILANLSGDERIVIGVLREVTDEKLLEQLTYEAEHDALTGLYNRKKCIIECDILLKEHPHETFVMVHFDIQKFRLYNSFFGVAEGDNLLKYIADMLRELYPYHDCGVFGRIEADVFFMCFPLKNNIIEKHREYIHGHLLKYRDDFQILGNGGIYIVEDRTLSVETMFNYATLAAKNNTNRLAQPISFFDNAMKKQLQAQQDIAREMQTAIDEEQFEVYLQPKYILFSGEPYGAEALVRWKHPERGLISPNDFISLFESNGFITTLDRYMWEHVCKLIRRWLDEGREVSPISVNVSRVSMYSPQIVSVLANLVEKYDVPVDLFNLELTESAYMDNPGEMKERLEELRNAGFIIMMDDFGSGYSSLNTLREIPVDYLKVDRAFLASVDRDKRSRLVLASVVHMASRMGIPVITEGVETDEQREFLASIGCDYVQGYLYAKPMPVDAYQELILSKKIIVKPLKENDESYISKITMNMDREVQAFADLIPHAVAFVDFVGNEFSYLSANKVFQSTFGMHKDVENMSDLLSYHISEKSYEQLTSMYRKIAKNHCSDECFITWKDDQNSTMYYLVKAQYLAKSAYSTVMITTFIDLTQLGKQALAPAVEAEELLMTKDAYTMREIDSYIRMLNQSFDIARLVQPVSMQVISSDVNNQPICEPGRCYDLWGKTRRCENCTALDCAKIGQNSYKIEQQGEDYYLSASHPVNIDIGSDKSVSGYVIETSTKLSADVLDSLNIGEIRISDEQINNLQRMAYEDPLTLVYNRRYFKEMKFLKDPEPGFEKGECIAFVMLDIKGFKKINDTYGHAVGDQIIVETANILCRRTRTVDSVIRYGGDEFLIVLHNCTEENVKRQIEGVRDAIAEIRYSEEECLPINASIGYAFRQYFNGSHTEATEMIKEADLHMREQKNKNNLL